MNTTGPYPMPVLRNAWYMAGPSSDLPTQALLSRRIADVPLVLFRDDAGRPIALLDRCPHRFAPLHMGRWEAPGQVRCAYHGLAFGADGHCTDNPHGERPPAAACVRSFPVLERHGMLWLWFGPSEQAAPDRLPDYGVVDPGQCHVAWRYMRVQANYRLGSDNILDLSHIQFLHPATLGSSAVSDARTQVEQVDQTVYSRRHIQDEVLPPFLQQRFGLPPGGRADRWLDVRWDPPASLLQTISIGPSGAPREQARTAFIAHLFSPETPESAHYWYASCRPRDADPDGAAWVQEHVDGLTRPFADEDRPILEAQQRALGSQDFWSQRPVLLATDAAAVRARRIYDRMLQEDPSATVVTMP